MLSAPCPAAHFVVWSTTTTASTSRTGHRRASVHPGAVSGRSEATAGCGAVVGIRRPASVLIAPSRHRGRCPFAVCATPGCGTGRSSTWRPCAALPGGASGATRTFARARRSSRPRRPRNRAANGASNSADLYPPRPFSGDENPRQDGKPGSRVGFPSRRSRVRPPSSAWQRRRLRAFLAHSLVGSELGAPWVSPRSSPAALDGPGMAGCESVPGGQLQVIGARGNRRWRAFWRDADGKHVRGGCLTRNRGCLRSRSVREGEGRGSVRLPPQARFARISEWTNLLGSYKCLPEA